MQVRQTYKNPRKLALSIFSICFSIGAVLWVKTVEEPKQAIEKTMFIADDSGYSPMPEDVIETLVLDYGEAARGEIEVLRNSNLSYTIVVFEEPGHDEPLYLDSKSHFMATFTLQDSIPTPTQN